MSINQPFTYANLVSHWTSNGDKCMVSVYNSRNPDTNVNVWYSQEPSSFGVIWKKDESSIIFTAFRRNGYISKNVILYDSRDDPLDGSTFSSTQREDKKMLMILLNLGLVWHYLISERNLINVNHYSRSSKPITLDPTSHSRLQKELDYFKRAIKWVESKNTKVEYDFWNHYSKVISAIQNCLSIGKVPLKLK